MYQGAEHDFGSGNGNPGCQFAPKSRIFQINSPFPVSVVSPWLNFHIENAHIEQWKDQDLYFLGRSQLKEVNF